MQLLPTDALLVIDMQRDFLPLYEGLGARLEVKDGDLIIPRINALAASFAHVILTQDWHPAGHISFASSHGLQPFSDTVLSPYGLQHLWPDHCIQGTPGADIHPALDIPHAELLLRKGFRKNIDSYSAFTENDGTTPTGLAGYLRERSLTRLFFVGVAYDYCVGFSAIEAAKLGFQAMVIEDLTRGISSASIDTTNATFARAGVQRVGSFAL